jgi:SAM-dependent methyltransferase
MAAAPAGGEDVPFLATVFGDPASTRILDLACGAGRHTIPLAERGYGMTGVDLSRTFLDHAEAAARAKALAIEWECRDMRDLPWTGWFDGALCFGNSFGYFDPADTQRVIDALARALKPGAPLVLETGTAAESLLPALQDGRSMQIGDILYTSAAKYQCLESRLDVEYTFVRGDTRETKTAEHWVYTARELLGRFGAAGFRLENAYSTTQRTPFTLGSPRLILVLRKI